MTQDTRSMLWAVLLCACILIGSVRCAKNDDLVVYDSYEDLDAYIEGNLRAYECALSRSAVVSAIYANICALRNNRHLLEGENRYAAEIAHEYRALWYFERHCGDKERAQVLRNLIALEYYRAHYDDAWLLEDANRDSNTFTLEDAYDIADMLIEDFSRKATRRRPDGSVLPLFMQEDWKTSRTEEHK